MSRAAPAEGCEFTLGVCLPSPGAGPLRGARPLGQVGHVSSLPVASSLLAADVATPDWRGLVVGVSAGLIIL